MTAQRDTIVKSGSLRPRWNRPLLLQALKEKPLIAWFAVGIALFHIYANTLGVLPTLLQNAMHFGLFSGLAFVVSTSSEKRATKSLNLILACLVLISTFYVLIAEDAVYERGVKLNPADWVAAGLLIFAALELTRRLTGNVIPILIVLALTYVGLWGAWIPGVFHFEGLSWETIIFRSIYGDDALFGTIAGISATYVFMFILFGAFLLKSGAGEFIINLARSAAGRFVGGPGFVAVFASALTGTISGSAVANTVSTGVITIPLMKRSGFKSEFAAGVEAASSTGGQLMPPIMGAGAFVMASTTQIPYGTIALMAILPAVLYFASVCFFVWIEAKRNADLREKILEDTGPTPHFTDVLRNGGLVFFIPIVILIGLLIAGFTPTFAAGLGILATIASTWTRKENRMGPVEVFEALELGTRNMVMTAVLLCAVGLIVNVIATTGLGPTFSLMINSWAGGSLIIALILIAIASLVLGLGLPVTAAYIVLGTLSAPALYQLMLQNQLMDIMVAGTLSDDVVLLLTMALPEQAAHLGEVMTRAEAAAFIGSTPPELLSLINDQAFSADTLMYTLLAAHMIIFWLSQDSNVTPPVCLAAFSAAAIAGARPMKTGFAAWRIAKGLYVIPVLMAYTSLMSGNIVSMSQVFIFALLGLWALTVALEGYAFKRLSHWERGLIASFGMALLFPLESYFHVAFSVCLIGLITVRKRQVLSNY
jgi:TRAP transporter 4TM/12TM fusion protein